MFVVIKFPAPGKTKFIKLPPSRAGKDFKCPGYARGGMFKLRFDLYIILSVTMKGIPDSLFVGLLRREPKRQFYRGLMHSINHHSKMDTNFIVNRKIGKSLVVCL